MESSDLQTRLRNLVDSFSDINELQIIEQLVFELKDFLQQFEQADTSAAEMILKDLEANADNALFKEVGKLLRRFHDQLVLIREGIPEDLGRIASQEVVEMSERLQMIVTMTDKAANTTLDLTEEVIDSLTKQDESLRQVSETLKTLSENENLPAGVSESLATALEKMEGIPESNNSMQEKLTNILIAQDYQDLTGQVIFKVINLLKSLEIDLAKLIDRFGQVFADIDEKDEARTVGPLGEDDSQKTSQNDVDALLNKFGF